MVCVNNRFEFFVAIIVCPVQRTCEIAKNLSRSKNLKLKKLKFKTFLRLRQTHTLTLCLTSSKSYQARIIRSKEMCSAVEFDLMIRAWQQGENSIFVCNSTIEGLGEYSIGFGLMPINFPFTRKVVGGTSVFDFIHIFSPI